MVKPILTINGKILSESEDKGMNANTDIIHTKDKDNGEYVITVTDITKGRKAGNLTGGGNISVTKLVGNEGRFSDRPLMSICSGFNIWEKIPKEKVEPKKETKK